MLLWLPRIGLINTILLLVFLFSSASASANIHPRNITLIPFTSATNAISTTAAYHAENAGYSLVFGITSGNSNSQEIQTRQEQQQQIQILIKRPKSKTFEALINGNHPHQEERRRKRASINRAVLAGLDCFDVSGPIVALTNVPQDNLTTTSFLGSLSWAQSDIIDIIATSQTTRLCFVSSTPQSKSVTLQTESTFSSNTEKKCLKLYGVSLNSNSICENGSLLGFNVTIGSNTTIKAGSIIRSSVFIGSNTIIGKGVYIEQKSQIGSNVIISDFVHLKAKSVVLDNCNPSNPDLDHDGFPDCIILPNELSNFNCSASPPHCSCPNGKADDDNDGVKNCLDLCPLDPNKAKPGICKCGIPDIDSDKDGFPNCMDGCPFDPLKQFPGVCGCGYIENYSTCLKADAFAVNPFCGNGIVEQGEICDDGVNDGSYGGCVRGCKFFAEYCGDGKRKNKKEECDDGNLLSGDGCSSDCKIEPGYICKRPNHKCIEDGIEGCDGVINSGKQNDCFGVCDGFAVLDDCGKCVGGTTGKLPLSSFDKCGVCFGNNSNMDGCGICFGNNSAMDSCGVCFGHNTTCLGCDGVPNSGKTVDICGVCDGDNSTCLGCDGIPIPLGGHTIDICGICGGENTGVCVYGCDDVLGSTLVFDCSGVCNGTAKLDACGICSGGTTNRIPKLNSTNCFTKPTDKIRSTACKYDICGVCNGDNSTCLGCDGIPIPLGGNTIDSCGICGGENTGVCVYGCDDVLGSTLVFDCSGVCNGTAKLDSCGICYGPKILITKPDLFIDSCGVCFGGNKDVDRCGQCFGSNALMDSCGVCGGNNAELDSCGVCFGGDLTLDVCGVCNGDGTSCLSCDGLINSSSWVDPCGECKFQDDLGCEKQPESSIIEPYGTLEIALTAIGLLFITALLTTLAAVIVIKKRRQEQEQDQESRFESKTKSIEMEANILSCSISPPTIIITPIPQQPLFNVQVPQGNVCFVFTGIHNLGALDDSLPQDTEIAVNLHNTIMRGVFINKFQGLEVANRDGSFMFVFDNSLKAVEACIIAQLELLQADWPQTIVNSKLCPIEYVTNEDSNNDGNQIIVSRGLRICMGVHSGIATCVIPQTLNYPFYAGQTVRKAYRTAAASRPGQILITSIVHQQIKQSLLFSNNNNNEEIHAVWLGAIDHPETIWQISHKRISGRQFLPLQSGGRSSVFPGVLDCFLRPDRRGSVPNEMVFSNNSNSTTSSRSSSISSSASNSFNSLPVIVPPKPKRKLTTNNNKVKVPPLNMIPVHEFQIEYRRALFSDK